jgi:dTDP-4-dehydrorhamnose reductase
MSSAGNQSIAWRTLLRIRSIGTKSTRIGGRILSLERILSITGSSMKSGKVMIFGSKGMLGQELARVFSDMEVLGLDFDECDITDATAVDSILVHEKPHLVINAAAYNAVDKAEEEIEIANKVNGDAVGNFVRATHGLHIPFVHYSSDYIFDGTNQKGYTEDAVPNPISAYGQSKLRGEQQPYDFYCIRLSRLFGNAGGGKKSFVDKMLDLAKDRDELHVVNEEFASPTYAPDLAQRTRDIVMTWNMDLGIYHAANHGACTWYAFAQEIFKQAHEVGLLERTPKLIPVSSSYYPRSAKRPAWSQLLNTKCESMRSWQEALREYLTSAMS